jgi:hypothetical protein
VSAPVPTDLGDAKILRRPHAHRATMWVILGFGVALLSGSRALGGLVLVICGGACIAIWLPAIWLRRDGRRTAIVLTVAGLLAFALSHLLGLILGAWPAVFLTAAGTAALYWRASDCRVD